MYQKELIWADNMRTGRIARKDVWLSLTSTIWRTLCYPLSAVNLTKKQYDDLMSPLLNYALPALGVCRTFPRALVFAPTKHMGLGIKHIHTVQEITRLIDILRHSSQHTAHSSMILI
jgi:hypothetical protein